MSGLQDFQVGEIGTGRNLVPNLAGKVVLAVNVASKCGLTPQYEGMEALYGNLKDQGLVIVGLPCNQFGGQEPGTEDEIISFCQTNYSVDFPMTEKIEVNGTERHPIYEWLTDDENGFPGDIEWNFEKFLIDRNGNVLHRYPPKTEPGDKGLLQNIADALPRI